MQILGTIIDINCLTWLFCLVLVEQTHLAQSCPHTHPTHTLVALLIRTTMLMEATSDVVTS
jgi:hypothetical protein